MINFGVDVALRPFGVYPQTAVRYVSPAIVTRTRDLRRQRQRVLTKTLGFAQHSVNSIDAIGQCTRSFCNRFARVDPSESNTYARSWQYHVGLFPAKCPNCIIAMIAHSPVVRHACTFNPTLAGTTICYFCREAMPSVLPLSPSQMCRSVGSSVGWVAGCGLQIVLQIWPTTRMNSQRVRLCPQRFVSRNFLHVRTS